MWELREACLDNLEEILNPNFNIQGTQVTSLPC